MLFDQLSCGPNSDADVRDDAAHLLTEVGLCQKMHIIEAFVRMSRTVVSGIPLEIFS